jgi:hypothetical protein
MGARQRAREGVVGAEFYVLKVTVPHVAQEGAKAVRYGAGELVVGKDPAGEQKQLTIN